MPDASCVYNYRKRTLIYVVDIPPLLGVYTLSRGGIIDLYIMMLML